MATRRHVQGITIYRPNAPFHDTLQIFEGHHGKGCLYHRTIRLQRIPDHTRVDFGHPSFNIP